MRRDGEAGFTLLEVLGSFVILVLVVTAIYQAQARTLGGTSKAEQQLELHQFARSQLEELLVRPTIADFPTSGVYAQTWEWEANVVAIQPTVPTRYDDVLQVYEITLTVSEVGRDAEISLISGFVGRR